MSDVRGHSVLTPRTGLSQFCSKHSGTNVHLPANRHKHCVTRPSLPLTHTEVWALLLVAVLISVVAEFVEPVVFGGYKEVPGQQWADAHQKEDDVHQIVRVFWTVAHSQRHWGMFGQEGCRRTRILALLILGHMVVSDRWDVGRVYTGLHGLWVIHCKGRKDDSQKVKMERQGKKTKTDC